MSKTDLRTNPVFNTPQDALKAHLTVVFAALAIAEFMQNRTGQKLKDIVRTVKPIHSALLSIGGRAELAHPDLPEPAAAIIKQLTDDDQA